MHLKSDEVNFKLLLFYVCDTFIKLIFAMDDETNEIAVGKYRLFKGTLQATNGEATRMSARLNFDSK